MLIHHGSERGLALETEVEEEQKLEKLLKRSRRLVERIANQYCNITGRWDLADDFVSEGEDAIVAAWVRRRPDSDEELQSKGLIYHIVRGAVVVKIHKECRGGMTGISRENYRQAKVVESVHDALMAKNGRKPTIDEIADQTGLTPGQVEKALDIICMSLTSFEEPSESGSEDGSNQWDIEANSPSAEEILEQKETLDQINEALRRINPNRRRVIELRSYLELGYEEIGKIMGKSSEAVRKDYERAIEDLRKILIPRTADAAKPALGGKRNG